MNKTPGQIAYEAYQNTPGVLAPVPWYKLLNEKQRAWHRVAEVIKPEREDGLTDDERDVWKAAYGAAMGVAMVHAGVTDNPELCARYDDDARFIASVAVRMFRSEPIEVSGANK